MGWMGRAAVVGIALPYAAIAVGWTAAAGAVREPYHTDGDAARASVQAAVWTSLLLDLAIATPWACSRPQPVAWLFAVPPILVAHILGVYVTNIWYYLSVGGVLP